MNIGSGSIGDFATPGERGKYLGVFSGLAMVSFAVRYNVMIKVAPTELIVV